MHRSLIALIAIVAIGAAPAHPGRTATDIVIQGIAVVDPASGWIALGHDIQVRDGRIVRVGPKLEVPPGAKLVDGRGKFAVPGFWDMHNHFAGSGEQPRLPEIQLSLGVVAVRDMGGDPERLAAIAKAIARAEREGPLMRSAGPTLNGSAPVGFHQVITDPADATRVVRTLKKNGSALVKVHNDLKPEVFLAICTAARAAQLPLSGHVPHGTSTETATDCGMRSVEHAEALMEAELFRSVAPAQGLADAIGRLLGAQGVALYERMVRNGTAFTPTLSAYKAFVDSQPLADARAMGMRLYRKLAEVVKQAHDHGVRILVGTDNREQPGWSVHDEMQALVEAGIPARDVLFSATGGAAEFMGVSDLGRIEAGMRGEFVLLEASPYSQIANTRRVAGLVHDGRYFDRNALAALRGEVSAPR